MAEYYLDLDFLSDFLSIKLDKIVKESTNESDEEETEEDVETIKLNPISTGIDVFKYEIIKMCLDRILFDKEINPESDLMSMRRSSEDDASYKLAFNTLLAHKIIKLYEREY